MRGKLSRGIRRSWSVRMGAVGIWLLWPVAKAANPYLALPSIQPLTQMTCRCSPKSSFSKRSPRHDQSLHVFRRCLEAVALQSSRSFVSTRGVTLLGRSRLFANVVRPNTLLWGTGCRSIARGLSRQTAGSICSGSGGLAFHAAKHEACTFDGKELMRACCRQMLMADRPSCASGEGSWY